MFILSQAQIKDTEQRTFASGMPVEALMEKAGLLFAQRIKSLYPSHAYNCVGIVAGPGHNGGDAFVVARELHLHGYKVLVLEIDKAKQQPLTAKHATYFASLGGEIVSQTEHFLKCDFYIDGLIGFGLQQPFGPDQIIRLINSLAKPVVSLDLPSGLHPDLGLIGACIRATHTLTLQFLKLSFCNDNVVDVLGQVECLDLGIDFFVNQSELLPTSNEVVLKLPLKKSSAHKYAVGKVSLVAGSTTFLGAGALCALACRETGIGYITLASKAAESLELLKLAPDIVCLPHADFSKDSCVLIGPGVVFAKDELAELIDRVNVPLVLDAGALQAEVIPLLKTRTSPTVLTPHAGEFEKMFPDLTRASNGMACASKISAACAAARETHAIIVLKGPRTVIASPEGRVCVEFRATPALARAGTGDVLAGLIAGLIPQFENCFDAVCFAVRWHAETAQYVEKQDGQQAVFPTVLIENFKNSLFKESIK